jgi:hypothetical protein
MGVSASKGVVVYKGQKPKKNPNELPFEPVIKIAWLIGNQKYNKVRTAPKD